MSKESRKRTICFNRVMCGDARKKLGKIPDASINLIYLDPPFFSRRNYNNIRAYAFNDRWEDGFPSYIRFMTDTLKECHRTLATTGSLYLHCDYHASHYLKIELDKICGRNNFRNEIIWRRHNAHNDTKQGAKLLGKVHDVILVYSKSKTYKWNPMYQPYPEEYILKYYRHTEPETGRRYALGDLTGPGGRSKGSPRYKFLGVTRYWRYSRKNMQRLYREGRIVQNRNGVVPTLKRYLDEMPGLMLQDVWSDIESVQISKRESTNFPTQKPLKLLERIIQISTDPKDIVLDPFCGSGTTLVAAVNLGRKYIGIDINPEACKLARGRLRPTRRNYYRTTETYVINRPISRKQLIQRSL